MPAGGEEFALLAIVASLVHEADLLPRHPALLELLAQLLVNVPAACGVP